MKSGLSRSALALTALTLVVGATGAGAAHLLGLPAALIIGPAGLISLAAACGVRFAIADPVRNAAFLLIGISVGAGVDDRAADAVARWPLAFLTLAVVLVLTMVICRAILVRFFAFDARSATLAAAPGHLSFVIGLGEALRLDLTRVTVVQTVRLLALTLITPFAALAFGVEVDLGLAPAGPVMSLVETAALVVGSIALGLVFGRLGAPAPLLIGAMVASSLAHLTGVIAGGLSPTLAVAAFVTVGSMIGARFSGVTLDQLREAFLAGAVTTLVAAGLAAAAAIPAAWAIAMPTAHVMIGFAPGGLETMIAMSAVLGASPGFVAACHVGRLLILSFVIPLFLSRAVKET